MGANEAPVLCDQYETFNFGSTRPTESAFLSMKRISKGQRFDHALTRNDYAFVPQSYKNQDAAKRSALPPGDRFC